ncbi:hypothetical protein [Rhodopseudomonas palustris]|nr:hypothetical protein [Rhodopseudomonas palustris]
MTESNYYAPGDGPLYRWNGKPRTKKRTVTMPAGSVHPLVRLVFGEMSRQARRYDDVETASGVRRASIKAWRKRNAPGLASITATLNTLGYDLVPVPAPEVIPTEIAPDLAALSSKLETTMPDAWAAIVSFAANQQLAREAAAQTLAKIDAARPLN